ncbi:MAG: hypothetical protein RR238_06315 [Lachnospiraceae bacterium]
MPRRMIYDREGWMSRIKIKLYDLDQKKQTLLKLNADILELSERLAREGFGELDYTDQKENIEESITGMEVLETYIKDVDTKFAEINDAFKRNVSKNAVESLSQIKMEDFKVANNLGIKSYQTVSSPMTGERNIEYQKQEIGIADFMGIYRDECDRNYVKEFALLFENKYKGKETDNVRDYLKGYYKDGEFDYQKYQPEKQMWSDIADIASLGILPIGEALFGWNPITGETLADTERGYKMMEGLVTLIPVGTAIKAVKTAAKTGSNLLLKTMAKLYLSETITDLSMYGTSCAVKDTELSPELQTALTFTAGAVAGKLSSEVLLNAKSLDLVTKGGTTSKVGYEYLNEQLESLKGNVKINQYQSAENVNNWWYTNGYEQPPYIPKTVVQDITLNSDSIFVRVYDDNVSGLKGGWVMRAEDIKGLTPVQIQEKFALPSTPQYIGEVKLDAGTTIKMGEVNSNYGYNGGGIQFDLKGQYVGEFYEIGNLSDWSIGK